MKILVCGNNNETDEIAELINSYFSYVTLAFCEDDENLLLNMKEYHFDMVMVFFDGALGMETVISVRRLQPEIPIAWFSDDNGFAAQSYRLRTDYFHKKPVTMKILNDSFASCGIANHSYDE